MRNILIIAFLVLFSNFSEEGRVVDSTGNQLKFKALYETGEKIRVEFDSTSVKTFMNLQYSYGSTIITPTEDDQKSYFQIPSFISNKAGLVSWQLIRDGKILQNGSFTIQPEEQPILIETYFGPRSIQAGDRDFSMLVAIPTDKFDNPTPDNTTVDIAEFFLGDLQNTTQLTENMFSWINIFSKHTSAKILVGVESNDTQTKELVSFVYPSTATDFKILAQREHNFADGNQIASIKTTILKDEFDNIVSDGTMVNFIITNNAGAILESSAGSIDGIATVKVLHPSAEDSWEIQANVTGMAQSDILQLNFKAALEDFPIVILEHEKILKVGPIKSFMNQIIPDGAEVVLKIENSKGDVVARMMKTSENGIVEFELNNKDLRSEKYTFKVITLGLSKSIQVTF
ncbi:hypothetical protein [Gillisia sp. Hel_I_29]|uniref:hypothetical protein n=1 Tax=Gillisia sp. Hel_I_29 TaxID=1249975 RepID=UPI00068AAB65|nr:hypothetical protein [Gillisia sp. Hel_I_29]